MAKTINRRVAVIGAGWAGCAAAVTLCRQGHKVTLIEASRTLGGRARAVQIQDQLLDNGQHIMLGAYTACLDLMRLLKIDQSKTLLRLPLQMVYPHQTGMQFIAPKLPAPLHLIFALVKTRGLNREDKMALARFSTTARWMDWKLNQDCTVSELLQRYEQTERLCRLMWNPLCIAALNTPPERASAQIFLNVLRDSLGANRLASDMLIPRVDLTHLLPEAAATYVKQHGGEVIDGLAIHTLVPTENHRWQLPELTQERSNSSIFDCVIVATNPDQCARLLGTLRPLSSDDEQFASSEMAFEYEPITTCYLQYPESVKLSRPFFALADEPTKNYWGQFIFDRGQLNATQSGLMAVVVSASTGAIEQSHANLAQAIMQQLAQQLGIPELAQALWTKVITEKRATFSCTPNLKRPTNQTTFRNLMIAGDFTESAYPATLEAAVRSGVMAAKAIV